MIIVIILLVEMLEIYETVLSVKFSEIQHDHSIWHPDVGLFHVTDMRSGHDHASLGYFYLDLFPRDGKYTHAACFPIQCTYEHEARCTLEKSLIQIPVAAMVANFTKP